MKRTPKILILGGGFAGVEVARELEKLLTPDEAILQLVSRDNFVLFTPMLHEIAASDLDISAIANPIRKMIRRTELLWLMWKTSTPITRALRSCMASIGVVTVLPTIILYLP